MTLILDYDCKEAEKLSVIADEAEPGNNWNLSYLVCLVRIMPYVVLFYGFNGFVGLTTRVTEEQLPVV